MHKSLEEFIRVSGRFLPIFEKYYNPSDPLEKALFNIYQLTKTNSFEQAPLYFEEFDAALLKGHKDINMLVFFILTYLNLCSTCNNTNERIASIAEFSFSLDLKQCHPIIKLQYEVELTNYFIKKGQFLEAEERYITLIQKAQDLKRDRIVASIVIFLAVYGKLALIDHLNLNLDSFMKSREDAYILHYKLLTNYIFVCNYQGINKHWSLIEKSESREQYNAPVSDLINITSLEFSPEKYRTTQLMHIAQAYKALLEKDFNKAKEIYAKALKINNIKYEDESIHALFPLHLALNQKELTQARKQLFFMKHKVNFAYILDFFYMRLALLEEDTENAAIHYNNLMHNIHRYKAMGRLKFETNFAHELKAIHMIDLYSNIRTIEGSTGKKTKPMTKPLLTPAPTENNTEILGRSIAIQNIKELIDRYANLKEIVFVRGDTGTGKELVARALHENSKRKKEPFLAINCGALTDTLLESELFGHEAGAFTGAHKARIGIFEAARKGTVFLDEFGEISPRMQVSLLRVLENNEIRRIGSNHAISIHCRIIVSTNRNLQQEVTEKKFREDLFYRINRFDIYLPPLKERKEDIPLLLHHYLNFDSESSQEMILSDKLIEYLSKYHWPGNIRELRNEMERCRVFNKGNRVVELSDFDFSRLSPIEENSIKEQKKYQKETPLTETSKGDTTLKLDEKQRIQKIATRLNKQEARLENLKQIFQEYHKLTCSQVMEIMNISQSTALKNLKILEKQGLLKRIIPNHNSRLHFFLWNQS